MRDPVLLVCPRCARPVVVVDWGSVGKLLDSSAADEVKPGFAAKLGAAVTQKLLRVPGRIVGPQLRRLLVEGSVGQSWCCASCISGGSLSQGVGNGSEETDAGAEGGGEESGGAERARRSRVGRGGPSE